jgi:uncharacterized membrane protein
VMPVGPILLSILVVLIAFGFLERVLDRMRLTDRQALLLAVAMLLGSLVDFDVAPGLRINLGGGILPLGLVAWLLITADEWFEPVRAVAAAVVTAGAVYLIGQWFPPGEPTELNFFFLDAQYLYGLVAGATGYLAGRSRRAAFCAGVLGVTLADLAHYVTSRLGGMQQEVITQIGGGGFWDTTVVAGVLAVLLAEFIGETHEALEGGAVADGLPGGDDRARR